jgi:hypothetical protein
MPLVVCLLPASRPLPVKMHSGAEVLHLIRFSDLDSPRLAERPKAVTAVGELAGNLECTRVGLLPALTYPDETVRVGVAQVVLQRARPVAGPDRGPGFLRERPAVYALGRDLRGSLGVPRQRRRDGRDRKSLKGELCKVQIGASGELRQERISIVRKEMNGAVGHQEMGAAIVQAPKLHETARNAKLRWLKRCRRNPST